mmetsp:Transcript_144506/g.360212  ORF Transcript_144506/g.360212 Transcript_144506/m.360212 type:complete len:116 (-) Transcript_144506:148-495(-)
MRLARGCLSPDPDIACSTSASFAQMVSLERGAATNVLRSSASMNRAREDLIAIPGIVRGTSAASARVELLFLHCEHGVHVNFSLAAQAPMAPLPNRRMRCVHKIQFDCLDAVYQC